MDSLPTSDASRYPSMAELRNAMDEQRSAFVKWLESLSAEQLAQPTAERWHAYAATQGDIAYFLAWHEGFHGGQLSTLRRAQQLPRAFG